MSEWNEHQLEAIDARGKSVVVSAAAGSGKTSVLSERVLRLIEEGEDIERMLIVTFTNLAAAEMKERIYSRLHKAGKERLAAQAEKCAFADISTIHSFCGRVIRENFEYAGVCPDYSVADDAYIGILKQRAMDETLEEASGSSAQRAFFERYSPKGDFKRVRDIIFAIYYRVISLKSPDKWLSDAEANFDSEQFIEVLYKEYCAMVREALRKAAVCLSHRTDIWELRGFPQEAKKSEAEILKFERIVKAIDISNVILPRAENISLALKGAPNGKSSALTNRANKCFEELRAYEGDFAGKVRAELSAEKGDALEFIKLARAFSLKYAEQKRNKDIIDHDDLLHLALKSLSAPGIAKRYRDKYTHVFVDEYQDINEVQDSILKLLIRGDNDFLVGDVKQCIYMFRESNPSILIARCEELRGGGLIEMNLNYRSEPGVIDFINAIMGSLMDTEAGGVRYSGGQALICSREGEGSAEIILAGGETDGINAEAAAIACYIERLKSEGFKYKDIAVLRPEIATSGKQLSRALQELGIPVSGGQEADSKFGEAAVFLNLLSVIDNPTDDLAMASVLRFPHFGFTEPDFASIRISAREEASFCDAVLEFKEDSELGKRVSLFNEEIERYRTLSCGMKLPDFLQRLRLETEFSKYALTSPAGGADDLKIAAFISAVTAGGVTAIRDALELADTADSKQKRPGEADAVFFTTIHKSKGLEFPAVILSGMHKSINQRDSYGHVLVGRKLGLAIGLSDDAARVRKPTLHRKAVARLMRAETVSESVRLIYVAMTRAINRLAIIGAGSEIKQIWTEEKLPGWQHEANTYFDLIIGAASLAGRDLNELVEAVSDEPRRKEGINRKERLNALFSAAKAARPADMFERYEYENDLGVPSKVSVTALKKQEQRPVVPVTYEQQEGLTAAQTGTLTHKALQKMGIAQRNADEIMEFIKQMEYEGVIEAGEGAYLDPGHIEAFLNSGVARRARESGRLLLEAPFCIEVPAIEAGIAQSCENVIVQGIIDLCFLEDGRWVIVDYKTDSLDRQNAKNIAYERYSVQLNLYARALEQITGWGVKEKIVYFLKTGTEIQL